MISTISGNDINSQKLLYTIVHTDCIATLVNNYMAVLDN